MHHGDIGHLHENKEKRHGKRLGRHIHHDHRSLDFRVLFSDEHKSAPLVSKEWKRVIPILDQGQVGSCTANAMTGMLGTEPFHALVPPHVLLNEGYALGLYIDETKVDGIWGHYPPDDTGSTGLAACKVMKQRGVIKRYEHCIGVEDLKRHIAFKGPVIIGISWRADMDQPQPGGLVRWAGQVEGGHEILVRGIDMQNGLFKLDNSWSAQWGAEGSFYMTFDDMNGALKDGGDAVTIVL